MEDRHSIFLELYYNRYKESSIVFNLYDMDNAFKFQALQTERERNCPVRFCSRQLPQSIAVILHLFIFYNTNVHE